VIDNRLSFHPFQKAVHIIRGPGSVTYPLTSCYSTGALGNTPERLGAMQMHVAEGRKSVWHTSLMPGTWSAKAFNAPSAFSGFMI